MKEHKIDELFRDKLQEHRVQPTAAAWQQISAGVHTRQRIKVGYYIAAAAVALLLSASWYWLHQQNVNQAAKPEIAQTEHVAPGLPVTDLAKPTPPVDQPETESNNAPERGTIQNGQSTAALAKTESAKNKTGWKSVNVAKTKPATNAEPSNEEQAAPTAPQELAEALPVSPKSMVPAEDPGLAAKLPSLPQTGAIMAQAEPVIIRYETASLNNKADDEKAPEKVLSVLQKVKQGEISLASIRTAKNNLLSGKFNKP